MKKPLVFLSAAAALMLSCQNSDPVREALLKRSENLSAPASVTYDAANSTNVSITVHWDATEPIENGAISFLVQVSSDEYFFSGEGGSLIERTIDISSSPNDAVTISGLTSGTSYFLRIAATYPGPSRSEWTYLSDETGKTSAVIPGTGLVN